MVEHETSASLHVLSVGSFGRAVAQHLRAFRSDLVETALAEDATALPAISPKSAAVIIASWRPVPRFCELLDEFSFNCERTFVPVILDSTLLRIGPVGIPGRGSCWGCWARRFTQHDTWREERSVLLKHYASEPAAGPQGYLEPFAMIGASRLASVLNDSNSSAGKIWQIDVITREITTGTVVGVHDCPRCGLHRTATERNFSAMRRELAYLWTQPSGTKGDNRP